MKAIIIIPIFILAGCAGATGDIDSSSEIIKGCSYIACAIVTHGLLQAFFRE